MANPEHLKILMRGVRTWNKWRNKNPEITPNLQGEVLKISKLIGINFQDTILRNSNLAGSNLSHASLQGANLSGANLNGATLIKVNLAVAECRFAQLKNADLSGAHCAYTNFSHANLSGANLTSVTFDTTIFGNTDLSKVKGLESCRHKSFSIVDHLTLTKSDRLPINFLRGCGLPDTLIEYIPSLLYNPIQFYSCFISYSSKDHMFAERLHADLQNNGVRCWLDKENLKIGDKVRVTIDETIRVHDKLLLVLSEHSVSSQWVEKEVETAMEQERDLNRIMLFLYAWMIVSWTLNAVGQLTSGEHAMSGTFAGGEILRHIRRHLTGYFVIYNLVSS